MTEQERQAGTSRVNQHVFRRKEACCLAGASHRLRGVQLLVQDLSSAPRPLPDRSWVLGCVEYCYPAERPDYKVLLLSELLPGGYLRVFFRCALTCVEHVDAAEREIWAGDVVRIFRPQLSTAAADFVHPCLEPMPWYQYSDQMVIVNTSYSRLWVYRSGAPKKIGSTSPCACWPTARRRHAPRSHAHQPRDSSPGYPGTNSSSTMSQVAPRGHGRQSRDRGPAHRGTDPSSTMEQRAPLGAGQEPPNGSPGPLDTSRRSTKDHRAPRDPRQEARDRSPLRCDTSGASNVGRQAPRGTGHESGPCSYVPPSTDQVSTSQQRASRNRGHEPPDSGPLRPNTDRDPTTDRRISQGPGHGPRDRSPLHPSTARGSTTEQRTPRGSRQESAGPSRVPPGTDRGAAMDQRASQDPEDEQRACSLVQPDTGRSYTTAQRSSRRLGRESLHRSPLRQDTDSSSTEDHRASRGTGQEIRDRSPLRPGTSQTSTEGRRTPRGLGHESCHRRPVNPGPDRGSTMGQRTAGGPGHDPREEGTTTAPVTVVSATSDSDSESASPDSRVTQPVDFLATEPASDRDRRYTLISNLGRNDPALRGRPSLMGVVTQVTTRLRFSGKQYQTCIAIRDPSCRGSEDFLVRIFVPDASQLAVARPGGALQAGNIVRLRHVKLERQTDQLDGRVFTAAALTVFSGVPDASLQPRGEHDANCTVTDAERRRVVWLRRFWQTQPVPMITLASIREPGLYRLTCYLEQVVEAAGRLVLCVRDGTACRFPCAEPRLSADQSLVFRRGSGRQQCVYVAVEGDRCRAALQRWIRRRTPAAGCALLLQRLRVIFVSLDQPPHTVGCDLVLRDADRASIEVASPDIAASVSPLTRDHDLQPAVTGTLTTSAGAALLGTTETRIHRSTAIEPGTDLPAVAAADTPGPTATVSRAHLPVVTAVDAVLPGVTASGTHLPVVTQAGACVPGTEVVGVQPPASTVTGAHSSAATASEAHRGDKTVDPAASQDPPSTDIGMYLSVQLPVSYSTHADSLLSSQNTASSQPTPSQGSQLGPLQSADPGSGHPEPPRPDPTSPVTEPAADQPATSQRSSQPNKAAVTAVAEADSSESVLGPSVSPVQPFTEAEVNHDLPPQTDIQLPVTYTTHADSLLPSQTESSHPTPSQSDQVSSDPPQGADLESQDLSERQNVRDRRVDSVRFCSALCGRCAVCAAGGLVPVTSVDPSQLSSDQTVLTCGRLRCDVALLTGPGQRLLTGHCPSCDTQCLGETLPQPRVSDSLQPEIPCPGCSRPLQLRVFLPLTLLDDQTETGLPVLVHGAAGHRLLGLPEHLELSSLPEHLETVERSVRRLTAARRCVVTLLAAGARLSQERQTLLLLRALSS